MPVGVCYHIPSNKLGRQATLPGSIGGNTICLRDFLQVGLSELKSKEDDIESQSRLLLEDSSDHTLLVHWHRSVASGRLAASMVLG